MKQGRLMAVAMMLLALLSVASAENTIGFDLGANYFKITLVKPGSPFSIVENVTSQRKTHSYMTIGKEERHFGVDSFNQLGKNPTQTFYNVASFLGKEFDSEELEELRTFNYVMNDFVQDERGLVAWQTFSLDGKEDTTIHYTEEIVAMILKYGRNLAEKQAEGTVVDAVITIPSYFNQEQRRMMSQAATLAGLNVVQLVHENTAAATMFGVDRTDEVPLTVLIYNMGGKDTEVTVARYSTAQDEKSGKTHEYIDIMGEGFDANLGGWDFDQVIVEILADKFNSLPERAGKPDVRSNVRALKRLQKEASKVKDVLSANKVCSVKVPELLDYVTLKFELQRSEFEERASSILDRVAQPMHMALANANITVDEIDQIEIIGGGLRVPRVQQIIKEITNKEELHVHLNGDEAMCFGAAFIASNSSSSFRVRKVYLTQHPQYDIKIEINPIEPADVTPQAEDDSEKEELVYSKELVLYKKDRDYLGQKKTISLMYDRGMKVDVFALQPSDIEDAPPVKYPLATYSLNDLVDIAQNDVAKKDGSTTPKVSLTFELSRSHFFKMTKASAAIDSIELEEIVPEPIEEEVVTIETNSEESEAGVQDEDIENETPEAEEVAPEETTEEEVEPEAKEIEYKEVVVPHTFPLKFDEVLHGVRILTEEQMSEARSRIKALEKRDTEKYQTDAARNTYESLIYEFRGWLNEDSSAPFLSESTRVEMIDLCNEHEDWLYEDGSSVGLKMYQTKTYDLQSHYTKYQARQTAYLEREEMVPDAYRLLADTRDMIQATREKKPWITEEEVQDVLDKVSETREWLDARMEEQMDLPLDEEPVLVISELNTKMQKVGKLLKKVSDKKKPKEKKSKKAEKKEEEDFLNEEPYQPKDEQASESDSDNFKESGNDDSQHQNEDFGHEHPHDGQREPVEEFANESDL